MFFAQKVSTTMENERRLILEGGYECTNETKELRSMQRLHLFITSALLNSISGSGLWRDPSLCRAGGCWWWIPVAGPMVGGAVGAGVYFLFIELHHPESIQENHIQDKYEIATMS